MVAFRFLALLTVGLSLLTFVFLLNVSNARLEREAIRQGMKTLRMAGLTKLVEGSTTLEEVVRVTAND